jgi:formiminotetrahydrofolate cyclodeaminase
VSFADRPLRDVLDELAARQPVPGGGGAAAWSLALGAGLVEMAARYASLEDVAAEAAALRARALQLAEIDGEGYAPVLEALRMDEDDPARTERLAGALSAAAEAPLAIALAAARVSELAAVALRNGTPHLRGDAAAGASIAAGACAAAAGLVEVDVGGREPADPRVAQAQDAVRRARAAAEGQSSAVARRAPSESADSFAQTIEGCTRLRYGVWANPQSVLAMTRSRPTSSARRTMRWATSSGCSTTLVEWLMSPGSRTRPSGSSTSFQTAHSCSWRGLACSSEYPPARTRRTRSTMSRNATSLVCGPFQLPQHTW